MNYFMRINVLVVKKCDDCGHMTKFQNKYRTEVNDQSLCNMKSEMEEI